MQPQRKVEYDSSAKVIYFNINKPLRSEEKNLQNEGGKRTCFRTSERYFCKDTECGCWNECKKLIAEWLR